MLLPRIVCIFNQSIITEEDGKVIFNYWTKEASRPTGDKQNIFRELHQEVNVKQRKFEYLKPFFVKQAKERDRKSCLCRKHVKMKIVFSACKKFRKAALKTSDQSIPVPKTLTECVNLTLCSKQHGASYHDIKCFERECTSCGVDAFDSKSS